jgi:hypothetical protein
MQRTDEKPRPVADLSFSSGSADGFHRQGANRSRSASGHQLLFGLAKKVRENEVLQGLVIRAFRAFQRIGISISPNHFYWPIPDVAHLEGREWPDLLPTNFDFRLEQQLDFARHVVPKYCDELRFPEQADANGGYHYNNGFFETVDAEIAYCLVREYKPARIVEVGGGFSTRVLAAALRANRGRDGVQGNLATIDPFPERVPPASLGDGIQLVTRPVQEIDLDLFLALGEGDILFIDSSHVVGIGSDVVREYLEIVPRLAKGVLVHVHDIFLPSDYPRDMVLKTLAFWSEQYLLQAFLSFNPSFEVLWASSAMQIFHPEVLEATFPHWSQSYRKMPRLKRRFVPSGDGERVWPSSFWMKRV